VTPSDPKLKRMQEQGEKLFSPEDAPPAPENDTIERWGRRIGRGLSVVIALAALWYIWSTLGR
jgi:hypothetical protein